MNVQSKTQPPSGSAREKSEKPITSVTKFNGMLVEHLLFIEVFARTARFSKAAKDVGFQIFPIDKTSARATQIFAAQYDLAEPDEIHVLVDLLCTESHRTAAVQFAPACGTASKAREKKFKQCAKRGFKIPRLLTSASKPGLDRLSGLDKVRTETANLVCNRLTGQATHQAKNIVLNRKSRKVSVLGVPRNR